MLVVTLSTCTCTCVTLFSNSNSCLILALFTGDGAGWLAWGFGYLAATRDYTKERVDRMVLLHYSVL
jgi:hypothetical protein